MAYTSFQGGYTSPDWYSEYNKLIYPGDEWDVQTLQSEYKKLISEGGLLKDVKAPVSPTYVSPPPYTPSTPSLGRVTSLADFLGSGESARLSSELRRGVSAARGKAYPEQAFTTGKLIEGYGKGRSDIASKAYGTAHGMHMGEVGAENLALQSKYNMALQEATSKYGREYQDVMNAYDLEMKKAMLTEQRGQSLLEMINRMMLAKEAAKTVGGKSYAPSLGTTQAEAPQSLSEMMKELEGAIGGGNISPSAYPVSSSYYPSGLGEIKWDYEGGPGKSEVGKSKAEPRYKPTITKEYEPYTPSVYEPKPDEWWGI